MASTNMAERGAYFTVEVRGDLSHIRVMDEEGLLAVVNEINSLAPKVGGMIGGSATASASCLVQLLERHAFSKGVSCRWLQ